MDFFPSYQVIRHYLGVCFYQENYLCFCTFHFQGTVPLSLLTFPQNSKAFVEYNNENTLVHIMCHIIQVLFEWGMGLISAPSAQLKHKEYHNRNYCASTMNGGHQGTHGSIMSKEKHKHMAHVLQS